MVWVGMFWPVGRLGCLWWSDPWGENFTYPKYPKTPSKSLAILRTKTPLRKNRFRAPSIAGSLLILRVLTNGIYIYIYIYICIYIYVYIYIYIGVKFHPLIRSPLIRTSYIPRSGNLKDHFLGSVCVFRGSNFGLENYYIAQTMWDNNCQYMKQLHVIFRSHLIYLAVLRDLFGMVKWPPTIGDKTVTLNYLLGVFFPKIVWKRAILEVFTNSQVDLCTYFSRW